MTEFTGTTQTDPDDTEIPVLPDPAVGGRAWRRLAATAAVVLFAGTGYGVAQMTGAGHSQDTAGDTAADVRPAVGDGAALRPDTSDGDGAAAVEPASADPAGANTGDEPRSGTATARADATSPTHDGGQPTTATDPAGSTAATDPVPAPTPAAAPEAAGPVGETDGSGPGILPGREIDDEPSTHEDEGHPGDAATDPPEEGSGGAIDTYPAPGDLVPEPLPFPGTDFELPPGLIDDDGDDSDDGIWLVPELGDLLPLFPVSPEDDDEGGDPEPIGPIYPLPDLPCVFGPSC